MRTIHSGARRWTRVFTAATVATLFGSARLPAVDLGWYAQAKAGQASLETRYGPPVFGWVVDDEDTSGGVELGVRIGRHLGLQAGYHDYGRFEGLPAPCPPDQICPLTIVPEVPTRVEVTGISLAAVPRWPLGEHFALFGKVGVIAWDLDLRSRLDGRRVGSRSDRDLLAGVGVEYEFDAGLALLAELEGFELDARSLAVGLGWRF
jgi:hypothetical protein